MPHVLGRQIYWFENWVRILIVLTVLYNELTHGPPIQGTELRKNGCDCLKTQSEGPLGQRTFRWEEIHRIVNPTGVPHSPLGVEVGTCTLVCFPCSWAPLFHLSLEPCRPQVLWAFRCKTLCKWMGKGCVKMPEMKTHHAGASFWWVFRKLNSSIYGSAKHIGTQWYREWDGLMSKQ